MVRMTQHGVVELKYKDSSIYLVNGERVKHFFGDDADQDRDALELNDE